MVNNSVIQKHRKNIIRLTHKKQALNSLNYLFIFDKHNKIISIFVANYLQ